MYGHIIVLPPGIEHDELEIGIARRRYFVQGTQQFRELLVIPAVALSLICLSQFLSGFPTEGCFGRLVVSIWIFFRGMEDQTVGIPVQLQGLLEHIDDVLSHFRILKSQRSTAARVAKPIDAYRLGVKSAKAFGMIVRGER